jgi:hypothetical protein
MVSLEQLELISTIPTASWAFWNENGPNDLTFFAAKRELLHGRAVVLGLNRSSGAHAHGSIPFINFHTPKHRGDGRLKRFIQDAKLDEICGAFMTDLSMEVETDSNKVLIERPKEALETFYSQLSFSSESQRTIVCMGDKTFDNLCLGLGLKPTQHRANVELENMRVAETAFNNEEWIIYRVWLHSSYGKFQKYGDEELPRQLERVNDLIKRSRQREVRT